MLRFRSEREKEIEILLLRHQLHVLERQIARPHLTQADRALLAALSRVLPRKAWRRSSFVTPATLLRWERPMKTVLITLTLVELALLVVVLAVYLIMIGTALQKISKTLGLVTFGVRAIETQTAPIGPVLRDINGALEGVAGALQSVVGAAGTAPDDMEQNAEAVQPVAQPDSFLS